MVSRPNLLSCLAVAGMALAGTTPALANGRFPATVKVEHVPGNNQSIFLPVTFGLLISNDDGASFHWMCEDAIGYSGVFDPDYALEPDGTIWATTFDGLRVTHDGGCNWTTIAGPLDGQFVGDVEVGPDGVVWATTSTGGQLNDVFRSTDGSTFTGTGLMDGSAWWRTLRIAPSNGDIAYVSGFRPSDPSGDGATMSEALAYKTTNGGTSWTPISLSAITFGTVPQLDFLAVANDDPNTVWAVAVGGVNPIGDALWVTTDGGDNWTKLVEVGDSIATFLAVPGSGGQYTLYIGTLNDGNRVSTNSGTSWTRNDEPRMACLSLRGDGTYFSCGANWEPDFFALARSTDAQSWTKVVRFSEIAGPVSCDPGTVQFDKCESQIWPDLVEMFGIGATDAGPDMPDAGTTDPPKDTCCSGGPTGAAPWLLAIAVMLLTARRRRRA